jgi:ATP-dependent Clp protease ATP-binding subunit ClpB
MKIEQNALQKESDKASKERLEKLTADIKELEAKTGELTAQWQGEKDKLADAQKLKEQLDQARGELEIAQREGDLNRASELKYGVIPGIEKQLGEAEAAQEHRMLNEEVTESDIAAVVSRWTGIPVDKMLEGEREKLLGMEGTLRHSVIGQEDAIVAISNAVRRARAGLQDPNRPIGSFLFLGPTGVGKTELTKALARFLFDDETAMVRLDMSEYMEKHAVARMIGAPPGYVGYDEGGALTEAVRRRPYQVVLLRLAGREPCDVVPGHEPGAAAGDTRASAQSAPAQRRRAASHPRRDAQPGVRGPAADGGVREAAQPRRVPGVDSHLLSRPV